MYVLVLVVILFIYACIYIFPYFFQHLFIDLLIYLFICFCIHVYIHVCIYLFMYLHFICCPPYTQGKARIDIGPLPFEPARCKCLMDLAGEHGFVHICSLILVS